MYKKQFEEVLHSIDKEKLEKSLQIEGLKKIEIIEFNERLYSYVSKCKVLNSSNPKYIYVKIQKIDRERSEIFVKQVLDDFETLSYWFNAFKNSEKFNVVKPLMVVPEQFLTITEFVESKTLYELISKQFIAKKLSKNDKIIKSKFRDVGEWLKYFYSISKSTDDKYSIKDLYDYIELRLDLLVSDKRRMFPSMFKEKVLSYVKNSKEHISINQLKMVISHRDFNLSNILDADDKIVVLDFFKERKYDSTYMDISRLYHQLFLFSLKPYYSTKYLKILQRELLIGYGIPDADKLKIFRLLLLRHTLTHLLTITSFWEFRFHEKVYNRYVLKQELQFLNRLLEN